MPPGSEFPMACEPPVQADWRVPESSRVCLTRTKHATLSPLPALLRCGQFRPGYVGFSCPFAASFVAAVFFQWSAPSYTASGAGFGVDSPVAIITSWGVSQALNHISLTTAATN